MADALNLIMNVVTLAGVIGLAAWAWWWVRAQRAADHDVRAEIRAVVREVGRLRMAERDTTELSRSIVEIRRMLGEDGYARGFLDAIGGERPPSSDRPFRVVR